MVVEPSSVNNGSATSSESELEPQVEEKWTTKRVLKVSWAYVTTLKVIGPQELLLIKRVS